MRDVAFLFLFLGRWSDRDSSGASESGQCAVSMQAEKLVGRGVI